MENIGISGEEQISLMKSLCIVLQLGNLVFEEDPTSNGGCRIVPAVELDELASLMGMQRDDLDRDLMHCRKVLVDIECCTAPLTPDQAKSRCDAFAKEIYACVFDWVVHRINMTADAGGNLDGVISMLDIFGFEAFKYNCFEQLCINYANEKLQNMFA